MIQDPTIGVIERSDKPLVVLDIYSKLLQDNIIFINEEINAVSVSKYQAELMYLKRALHGSREKVITININSPGGSVYDALGLYDAIKRAQKQGYTIKTVNVGMAASAAAVLLMAGSKGHRESYPDATVMVHELAGAAWGRFTNVDVEYKEMQRLHTRLKRIITENSSAELATEDGRDHYLDADDAKKFNVIDTILEL